MNIPEQLYYKLEEDGCWHEVEKVDNYNGEWVTAECTKCGKLAMSVDTINDDNPNLSDPDWSDFGWMIERAKEAEWWDDFTGCEDGWMIEPEFLLNVLTSPTALRDALVEYFGLKGGAKC